MMAALFDDAGLRTLIEEFRSAGTEQDRVEFKSNHLEPEKIGQYLSGLSNAAALSDESHGFLIFGIEDGTHDVRGTTFDHKGKAKGNEDLEPWLARGLDPQVHFEFHDLQHEDKRLVVLVVEAANHRPVSFSGAEFVRVGSHLKDLRKNAAYERRLWEKFSRQQFEDATALDRLSDERVLKLLNFEAYFEMTDQSMPGSDESILRALSDMGAIRRAPGSGWQITNLGALLLAEDLGNFPTIVRKAPRVIEYDGEDKAADANEQVGARGYATAFSAMLRYVENRLPKGEDFVDGIRKTRSALPSKALRELVANALIHQDLTIAGSGPLVEIYSDRVEVTSPGDSMVDPFRLIDAAPISRNESLARMMRLMGVCEERGSGWDQIADLVEAAGLPAPLVETGEGYMRVTLYLQRPLSTLTKEEIVRAILFHACKQYAKRQHVTNASLRDRFRIDAKDNSKVSRLLKTGLDAGVIEIFDSTVGLKARSYVPFFAKR